MKTFIFIILLTFVSCAKDDHQADPKPAPVCWECQKETSYFWAGGSDTRYEDRHEECNADSVKKYQLYVWDTTYYIATSRYHVISKGVCKQK